MSHCFCFRVMSSSLVSSRISSRVRKCVSPFWCLVWDSNTESLRFTVTVNHIQMPTLSPCLMSNHQHIDSSGFVINRWHTKHFTHLKKICQNEWDMHQQTSQMVSDIDRTWLPFTQKISCWHTCRKNDKWHKTASKDSRSSFLMFYLIRSEKRDKISSETYLHVVDYFG